MQKILVLGHGIAGALLSYQLRRMGADVFVVEHPSRPGSSRIAAGIINPVTGKRYAKSWDYEKFWTAATTLYRQLESEFGIQCLHERPILRLLGSAEEANNWSARCALPEFQDFMAEAADAGIWQNYLAQASYYGRIDHSAQVDFKTLLDALEQNLRSINRFEHRNFSYDDISAAQQSYDAIVCCEGAMGSANPFFPEIRWQSAKGEGLLVEFLDQDLNQMLQQTDNAPMLKKDLIIASPGGRWQGLSWVGASFYWDFENEQPTEKGHLPIIDSLEKMLSTPYRIHQHFAGIRPVVTDRRPLLGCSLQQDNCYVFNGLGAKGALLAPYWSQQMAAFVLEQKTVDPVVNVARFRK